MGEWLRRFRHLIRRSREDSDLREEMDAHRAMRQAQLEREGLSTAAAALASRRALGNVTLAREDARDVWVVRWVQTLRQDVRQGYRALLKSPQLTATMLFTLILGLGANAATFGMVDRLVLRPFTIANLDRLVALAEVPAANVGQRRDTVAPANFVDWREQSGTLRRLTAFTSWSVNLSGGDEPETLLAQRVGAEFFSLIGATPALGRLLQPSDDEWGGHRQIVISDGLWHRRFGGDASVVGRTVRLDGEPFTIVGITRPTFDFPPATEAWLPLALRADEAGDRSRRSLTVIGELRDGATLEGARAEMSAIYERQRQGSPDVLRNRLLLVDSFSSAMIDPGLPAMLGLWQAAAVAVLLIGCVNLAGLLLARGVERRQELAVRVALGAGRRQLVRQLAIESLILALIAVPLALVCAFWLNRVVVAAMPATLVRYVPGMADLGIDARVAAFTCGVAVAASLVFGLLPALSASRVTPAAVLQHGGRSLAGGRGRMRRSLVVVQIALVLPLLVAAALAALAAQRFAFGSQGYNPEGLFQFRLRLAASTYPNDDARRQFVDRLIAESTKAPEVTSAAVTTTLPSSMFSGGGDRRIWFDGVPDDPDHPLTANYRAVSSGYLETMEIPLREGRSLTTADRDGRERVSVVSESFVRKYFGGASAIGRRVRIGRDANDWTTVVGVSADTIDDWVFARRVPTIFVPMAQFPSREMTLVARTMGDPARLADSLRRALAAVDPTQPVFYEMTVREVVKSRTTGLRFVGSLMAGFGGVALALSAVGIYGVLAHLVAVRRRELGLRIALGATARDVLSLALGQGVRLTALGIVLGALAAVGLARLIETALFGIVSLEWPLVVSIAGLVAITAAAAGVVPARRALRIDPAMVLKD
jgi:putative ABC transport system permease protein